MARNTQSPENKKATELTDVINAAKSAGQLVGSAVGRGGESFRLTLGDRMRVTAVRKSKGFDSFTVLVEKKGKAADAQWIADGAPLRGKPARQVFTALQDMHRDRQSAELRNAASQEGPAGPGD